MNTIYKETRSVTISKNVCMEICDFEETVLLCLTFLNIVYVEVLIPFAERLFFGTNNNGRGK